MSSKKETKIIIDENGAFRTVEISKEEAQRRKHLKKIRDNIKREEYQDGRLASNWFRV